MPDSRWNLLPCFSMPVLSLIINQRMTVFWIVTFTLLFCRRKCFFLKHHKQERIKLYSLLYLTFRYHHSFYYTSNLSVKRFSSSQLVHKPFQWIIMSFKNFIRTPARLYVSLVFLTFLQPSFFTFSRTQIVIGTLASFSFRSFKSGSFVLPALIVPLFLPFRSHFSKEVF